MNGRKARVQRRDAYRTRIRLWQWTDQQITQSLKSIERKGQQV